MTDIQNINYMLRDGLIRNAGGVTTKNNYPALSRELRWRLRRIIRRAKDPNLFACIDRIKKQGGYIDV